MKPRTMLASLTAVWMVCAGNISYGETEQSGSLVTKDGKGISGQRLRELLDACIPTDDAHSTLVVLTQCFGGNMVDSLSGREDTAVVSATSEGETATYGGYDEDAAGALKPGAGTDSDDVHDAGTAGKAAGETPSKSGDPVPLDPVDPENGPIKSRHILVYAGCPDGGGGTSDAEQLETIEDNFAGEPNTTVTSVGGDGTGVWDHPGTEEGLKDALGEIKKMMNADEQFILFVTDHGDEDVTDDDCGESGDGTYQSEPLQLEDGAYLAMERDPANEPALTVFVDTTFPPAPAVILWDGLPLGQVQFDTLVDLNRNGIFDEGDGWEGTIFLPELLLDAAAGNVVTLLNMPPGLNPGPSVRLSTGAIHKTLGDCNENGQDDAIDLSTGVSEDCNANNTPDECELAEKVVEEFFNPGSEPFIWWLLGDASIDDAAGAARLVHSGVEFAAGVAALNETGYATDAFEIEFDLAMANPAGGVPDGSGLADPDGLTFIVTSEPITEPGQNGYGLGYKGLPSQSFAVEFDTFQNFVSGQPDDPDSNHVGIDVGGSVESIATAPVTPDFDKSAPWHVRVLWIDDELTVYTTSPDGEEAEAITQTIPEENIPTVKYFAFGSGTGVNSADTDVDNVVITLLDADANGNGILDECEVPAPCEGDVNGDGTVDPLDGGFIQARFGCAVGAGDESCDAADANGDGIVDPLDVGFVQARFGPCQNDEFVGIGIAFDGAETLLPASIIYLYGNVPNPGLKEDDVIVEYRGIPVNTGAELMAAVLSLPEPVEGELITLRVIPGGVGLAIDMAVAAAAIAIAPETKTLEGHECRESKGSDGKIRCRCWPNDVEFCIRDTFVERDPDSKKVTSIQVNCSDTDTLCEGDKFTGA